MQSTLQMRFASIWLCLALLGVANLVQAQVSLEPGPKYVQASRLVLRGAADKAATALTYLPTNAQLRLIEVQGEWCEVEQVGLSIRGFVACSFVGDTPVELAAVQRELNKKPGDLDLLQKQFWISPSVEHLTKYGNQLTQLLVTNEHRRKEYEKKAAIRPKRAEFEAMKDFLRNGWAPPKIEASLLWTSKNDGNLQKLLPAIKSSLFKNRELILLLAPYVGVRREDANTVFMAEYTHASGFAAVLNGSADAGGLRVREYGKPHREFYSDAFTGAWDVDGATVELPMGGVPFLGLAADGKSLTGTIKSYSLYGESDLECNSRGDVLELAARVPSKMAKTGFLAFVLNPQRFGIVSAKLIHSGKYMGGDAWDRWNEERSNSEKRSNLPNTNGFVSAFDLDADGVADIVFLGAIGSTYSDLPPDLTFDAYVNILGKWVMYGQFFAKDCG